MNCGCIVKGNPFDMNQRILEPCVIHLMYAVEKTKGLDLQNQELRLAIQRAHGQFVEFFKGAMPDAASLPHLMAAHKALRQSSAVADGGEGPFCGCGWYANHPGECNHGVKPKSEVDSEPSKCRSHDYSKRFGGERICELCGDVEKRESHHGPSGPVEGPGSPNE